MVTMMSTEKNDFITIYAKFLVAMHSYHSWMFN